METFRTSSKNAIFVLALVCSLRGAVSQGALPLTPSKFYAVKASTVQLPCMAGTPGDKLHWVADHEDDSLRSRSSNFRDPEDPNLLMKVINNVQASDAGAFLCVNAIGNSVVELIVIDQVSIPEEVTAEVTAPDEIMVRWKEPSKSPELVKGYKIYVTEVTGSAREVTFNVDSVSSSGEENFLLEDIAPGATYEIQVVALYPQGAADMDDRGEGPRSAKIRIDTPNFDSPPSKVVCKPWKNSTIIVTWEPPANVDPRGIDGYKIFYKGRSKRQNPMGEVTVTAPGPDGKWQGVLDGLPKKIKYNIAVAAFTGGDRGYTGRRSPTVEYRHDGFSPELSISAVALGPESVLITLQTVGPSKVDKLRVLYTDESAIEWKRVEKIKKFDPKMNYIIVDNLQPRTRYFFMAKVRVNKRSRQTVTHVFTPPSVLEAPENVTVTANTDNSVLVTWEHESRVKASGFIIKVMRELPSGKIMPYKQQVVFKENEALVQDLYEGQKYQVLVEPFDLDGKGVASEPVHFSIAASDIELTTPASDVMPPKFLSFEPENMEINPGDDVKLKCYAMGTPNPEVRWFKDGQPVGEPADRSNELLLQDVRESTELQCRAVNSAGSVVQATNVTVTRNLASGLPYFVTKPPERVEAELGSSKTFVCKAAGDPAPQLRMIKGSESVAVSRRGEQEVTFVDTRVDSSYTLRCEAYNSQGTVQAVTEVVITGPKESRPVFTEDLPEQLEIAKGDSVRLVCSAEGHPPPSVLWLKNGFQVGKAMDWSNTLSLPSITESTNLVCRATNRMGSIVTATAVEVTGPPGEPLALPKFIYPLPEQLDIDRGKNLKLLCGASGNPMPFIEWFQGGGPVGKPMLKQNELSLNGVEANTELECMARNSVGSVSKIIKVQIKPAEASKYPVFVNKPPERLIVKRGKDVNIVCEVSNDPPAIVTIFKNNRRIPSRRRPSNRVMYRERRVARPFAFTCVARNKFGSSEASTFVQFTDQQVAPPTPVAPSPPDRVVIIQGEQLKLACAFDGKPEPMVTWYNGSTPIGQARRYQNILLLPSVETSTTFKCKGVNNAGTAEQTVKLTVISRRDTSSPAAAGDDDDYRVDVTKVPLSPSQTEVKWAVNRGDLDAIRSFHATVMAPTGQVLMTQRMDRNQRSLTLRSLQPGTMYILNLLMKIGNNEVADNSTINIMTQASDGPNPNQQPVLNLNVIEIREESAKIDFSALAPRPNYFRSYRLKVKDLTAGSRGNTIFDRAIQSGAPVGLQRLKPGRRYQVILDAVPASVGSILTADAIFETQKYGTPVSVSSADSPGQSSQSTTATIMDLTTSTTTTTTTVILTTAAPTPGAIEEDDHHTLNLRVPNKTPYRVDIRWTVDRGDLKAVKNFVITIKGKTGRKLLQQELRDNQRSITIHSLSPNTKYFVNLKANGDSGVLAEADLPVLTPSADAVAVTSSAVLDLEANEIRPSSARLDWLVVNGDPKMVNSYSIQVLDGGPGGFNLLTQKVPKHSQSLNLQKLLPNKRYHVIIDALDASDNTLMKSSLTFATPAQGRYGVPVRASSNEEKSVRQPEPTQRPPVSPAIHEPILDMEVSPTAETSARLTWQVAGGDALDIKNYRIRVRSKDQNGFVLLENSFPSNTEFFAIDGVRARDVYYIELEALGAGDSVLLSAGVNFRMPALGEPRRPVRGSSLTSPTQGEGPPPPPENPPTPPPPASEGREPPLSDEPALDLELNPSSSDQARLNWTLYPVEARRILSGFNVTVRKNDARGEVFFEDTVSPNIYTFFIMGLQYNQGYHIRVSALKRNKDVLVSASSPYLVPPPGHSVGPIRTSSSFGDSNSAQSSKPGTHSLTIVQARRTGAGAFFIKWLPAVPAVPTTGTMLRYAEFDVKGLKRQKYKIKFVPSGQNTVTIVGLKSGATYGFQVASMVPQGQYVRWSKLVLKTMDQNSG